MKVLWLHNEINFYQRYLNYLSDKNDTNVVNDSFFDIENLLVQSKKNKISIFFYTRDIDIKKVNVVIFEELPDFENNEIKNIFKSNKPKILIQRENQFINQKYKNLTYYDKFNHIFTWNSDLLNNKKFNQYYKGYNFSKKIKKSIDYNKKKFISFISFNKVINYYETLYPLRLKIIKWFNKNCPDQMDLFGIGWDKYYFKGPRALRIFNKINFFSKLFSYNFKVYKGNAGSSLLQKLNIMKNYKFHFAFENARLNGWITEKLFHAFLAKTVPIYFGAPNIKKFIPQNCYINFENYKNIEELYLYLKNMTQHEYIKYLDSAEKYLNSKKKLVFDVQTNISKIIKLIKIYK